jgi:hypothetical protein
LTEGRDRCRLIKCVLLYDTRRLIKGVAISMLVGLDGEVKLGCYAFKEA